MRSAPGIIGITCDGRGIHGFGGPDFGPKVPKAVQQEVLARQKDIAAGRLKPFAGPIVDNEGREVVPKGQAMTDEQILSMNFLVSGVQGRIAK